MGIQVLNGALEGPRWGGSAGYRKGCAEFKSGYMPTGAACLPQTACRNVDGHLASEERMNQLALFAAIDRAIKTVASEEFHRLKRELRQDMVSPKVCATLDSFEKLQKGIPPNYSDPWTALFYLTWYQPGQISLAHSLIGYLNGVRRSNALVEGDNHSLHVMDFGCGALAMQFAVAWAAAEAFENEEIVKSIRIYSCDTAQPMIDIGRKLWAEFKRELQRDRRLTSLSGFFDVVIEPRYGTSAFMASAKNMAHDDERWLTALHTVYRNNLEETKRSLSSIVAKFNPDAGLMSCHADEDSRSLLDQAAPFAAPEYTYSRGSISPLVMDCLHRITRWRRAIKEKFSIEHPYLDREVTWSFASAFGSIYTRMAVG